MKLDGIPEVQFGILKFNSLLVCYLRGQGGPPTARVCFLAHVVHRRGLRDRGGGGAAATLRRPQHKVLYPRSCCFLMVLLPFHIPPPAHDHPPNLPRVVRLAQCHRWQPLPFTAPTQGARIQLLLLPAF